jgi:hypothetical protein
MTGIAAFIMKGRPQAVFMITLLTVLSWMLSLAGLLAAAGIALPTLRRGSKEGLLIAGMTLPAVAIAGQIIMGDPIEAVAYTAAIWAPTIVIALILRESANLSLTLASALGLSLVTIVAIYGFSDNPSGLWLEQIQAIMKPMMEQGAPGIDPALLQRSMELLSRYATGSIAAGSLLTVALSVLLARWWQASLYNPGGFRTEFLQLEPSKWFAYGVLALLALGSLTTDGIAEMAINLAIPFMMVYLLVGFAVIHALCLDSKAGKFWLAGVYVGLFFIAPLIGMIAVFGFSDTWIHWRLRFNKSKA